MRKLPNCFPRHFTFLPQCLMVLFFYIFANIRHFVLILTILLCVWGGLVWELALPLLFPKDIFFPKVSLFSDDKLNLLPFTLGFKVLAPFLSGNISEPLFPSNISVSKSLWWAFALASPSLDPLLIPSSHWLWSREHNSQWMLSQIHFHGSNSSKM